MGDLAAAIGAELIGDPAAVVSRIASVEHAGPQSITFITGKKYLPLLAQSEPAAVVLPLDLRDQVSTIQLLSENPYLAYARLTQLWADALMPASDGVVHPSATIAENAQVDRSASIGPGVVVQESAVVGARATIGAGAVIGHASIVGEKTSVHPNATIMHGVTIGSDCEIHSGAVIGADGFGWAPSSDGWVKIHQLGGVQIGNRVSIGACTTVDRGALDNTIIADGVILDNQIQVAHNVVIGENTAIAGCTGIAGSTTIGRNCRIGGAVSIVGHISICDDVLVTANSFVNRSIKHSGSYSSGYPLEDSKTWRKNAVRLHRLDQFARNVIQKS